MSEEKNCCDYCDDGEGFCLFPMYGLAPHYHDFSKTGSCIGSTVIEHKSKWPANFVEDEDCKGCGIYTHCLDCGRATEY